METERTEINKTEKKEGTNGRREANRGREARWQFGAKDYKEGRKGEGEERHRREGEGASGSKTEKGQKELKKGRWEGNKGKGGRQAVWREFIKARRGGREERIEWKEREIEEPERGRRQRKNIRKRRREGGKIIKRWKEEHEMEGRT